MEKRKMWVEWKDGADLSQSRKKPGNYSPLTRDVDGNLGHVTLCDIDEDDEPGSAPRLSASGGSSSSNPVAEVLTDVLAEVIPYLVDLAYTEGKPHVMRWWEGTARPGLQSTRQAAASKLVGMRPRRRRRIAIQPVAIRVGQATSDSAESGAIEPERPRMSKGEAQQRLVSALIARAYSERQIEILLGARVDAGDEQSLEDLLQQVPPNVIDHQVSQLLQANPSLHEELLDVFWTDNADGGSALPLPVEQLGRQRMASETEE